MTSLLVEVRCVSESIFSCMLKVLINGDLFPTSLAELAPGTGVIADATSDTSSNATSPTTWYVPGARDMPLPWLLLLWPPLLLFLSSCS
jgi:hypothetical protein